MKKLILILLFTTSIFGQTETLISSVIYSVISGQTEYYRMVDRAVCHTGDLSYSKKWHNLQYAEVGSALMVGGSIALTSEDLFDAFKQVLMVGAVRWVVRDGVYNLNQKNNFFYQSPNTTSILEPFGYWYIKIGLLLIIIMWNYL